jgi:hypothetical protein
MAATSSTCWPKIIQRRCGQSIEGAITHKQWRLFVEALRAWRGEAARARMRGMISGVFHLPQLLRKRRLIQATRKVDDAYLLSILEALDTD